ncbi:MAG: 50S ribosomal protein L11 methyltransferase [Actinobacteria bacterium]|nr:50S ribosomal protein L11 methyltransferase [Actinomycetota bacterium]
MIRLAIRCRAEDAELALAQLMELAPSGVEEVRDGEIVEYAVYGPPGEVPELPDLRAAVGGALVEVTTSEVADDWHERWKQFHGAVLVGDDARGRVLLRPTWEPADEKVEAHEIVLDPGQAFGTGSHPTTRLCLELMLDLRPEGELVDLGCGSGVLAIAARKLGWDPVRGYDFDPLAVEATEENARLNDVSVSVARADLRDGLPAPASTALANLMRPLLLDVARQIGAAADSGAIERMILSGLLNEEADEIAAAYDCLGFSERRRVSEGGWTGLLLAR